MHEPTIGCPTWRRALHAVLAAGAFLLMIMLSACTGSDPEQALRERLDGLQQAVTDRDPAAVQQFLAEDFIGNEGLDRQGARQRVAVYALRYRDVSATAGPLQIAINGHHATVRFTVALAAGSGGLLPERGRVLAVETGWRHDGDTWWMTSMRWRDGI